MSETRLYVEFNEPADNEKAFEGLAGAHGLVLDPLAIDPDDADRLPAPVRVLRPTNPEDPGAWREQEGLTWASDGGLAGTARLRDAWPDLDWVPRLTVFKPTVRYHLSNAFPGEGFKVYMPDTSAIRGYRMIDDETGLAAALARAAELGFHTLWLHALDAEEKGMGLDLELLEQARTHSRARLWLSGGAAHPRHLANLAAEGGTAAVVVGAGLAQQCGCEPLLTALATTPVASAATRLVTRPGCAGRVRV
jgi:hypothetical protein